MWSAITELDLSPINHVLDAKILYNVLERTVSLRKLDLTGSVIEDEGLTTLRLVPNITSLTLAFCEEFSIKGLSHISSLTRLEELDCNNLAGFRNTRSILANQILQLLVPQRNTLKRLNLCGAFLRSLKDIKKFTALTSLSLYECRLITEELMPFLELTTLTNLDTLELSNMGHPRFISNQELLVLSSTLTNLRHLGVGRSHQLTSDGLANLRYLPKLELINIMSTWGMQSHAIIPHLRHCTQLKTLVWTCDSTNPVDDVQEVRASFSQIVDVITRGEFMYVM